MDAYIPAQPKDEAVCVIEFESDNAASNGSITLPTLQVGSAHDSGEVIVTESPSSNSAYFYPNATEWTEKNESRWAKLAEKSIDLEMTPKEQSEFESLTKTRRKLKCKRTALEIARDYKLREKAEQILELLD